VNPKLLDLYNNVKVNMDPITKDQVVNLVKVVEGIKGENPNDNHISSMHSVYGSRNGIFCVKSRPIGVTLAI
jgi:hypothetical protein